MTNQLDPTTAGDSDLTYSKAMLDAAFSDEGRPRRHRHERGPPVAHAGDGDRYEEPFAIYDVADVRAALGEDSVSPGFDLDGYEGDPEEREPSLFSDSRDSDQQARLRTIIARGERGRWRAVVGPRPDALDAIQALSLRAPHMRELTDLVSLHVRALAQCEPSYHPAQHLPDWASRYGKDLVLDPARRPSGRSVQVSPPFVIIIE